jgi:ABC-2 type transport system permease protein
MIRTYRAELRRLTSRRGLLVAAVLLLAAGVGGPALVFSAAKPAAQVRGGGSFDPTVESLSAAGGGTQVFQYAAAFMGTLMFVLFTGLFAAEHSRGTYRTMLLRQPGRTPLLAGKLAALLTYAGGLLALLEVVMWVAGQVESGIGDVSTAKWTTAGAIPAALGDYLTVLAWVTGYAVYALALGILIRSVPIALAVGIGWAGPIEHIVSDSWTAAHDWFPGLLLEEIGQGGTGQVTLARALATTAAYVAVAGALTVVAFRRRDVTA